MTNFIKYLEEFQKKRILVVGDVMLDKYIKGTVTRISPEAPIPVIAVKEENYVPGGAANNASNIAALNGNPYIIAIVGNDSAADHLENELRIRNVTPLFVRTKRPTTQKIRLIGQNQQLVRIDYEETNGVSDDVEKELMESVRKISQKIDGIVVSDYAKGVITENLMKLLIEISKQMNIPIIVDPKPEHKEFYRGATVITPNSKEASEMTGIIKKSEEDTIKIGLKLSSDLDTNVVLTRGEKGMSLFEKKEKVRKITHIPTAAKEVYDVSGAGDTVVATMILSLVSGATLQEAALLANHAAGIKVSKFGTATVSHEELRNVFKREEKKIRTREELARICEYIRKEGKKIGFTSGSFDLIHAGHVDYLRKAKQRCHMLIVGVNSDTSVRKYKGENRPIIPEDERMAILASLESVDYVFLFDERRNKENIQALKPDFYIKAGDYKVEELTSRKYVEEYGGQVILIPMKEGVSSTKIIEKIATLTENNNNGEKKPLKSYPAVFLDRDGVINEEVEYLHEPEKFKLLPGVVEGLKELQNMGYKLIIVTSQAGIGLGYFTKEDFYKVNKEMFKQFSKEKIIIDKVYFCPHSKKDNCDCRKPAIGMIKRGEEEENINLARSFIIGDKTSDILAGKNAGLKTILVKTGHVGNDKEFDVKADFIARDMVDAVKFIKEVEGK